MKRRFSACCAAFLFLAVSCLPSPLRAQEAEEEVELKQIPLTSETVKNFVAAFQEVKSWQKPAGVTGSGAGNLHDLEEHEHDDALSVLRNAANTEKTQELLKKHHFATLEDLEQTAQSVMWAYNYADPESGLADPKKSILETIEQIKKDENLPQEEKDEAIKNLAEEMKTVDQMKPLPGNVETVRPFVPEIKKMMESD